MIVGILLIGDDVSDRLCAAAGSVFVHMNGAIVNLHEVVRVFTARVPDDDVPTFEIFSIEEFLPNTTFLFFCGCDVLGVKSAQQKKKCAKNNKAARSHKVD